MYTCHGGTYLAIADVLVDSMFDMADILVDHRQRHADGKSRNNGECQSDAADEAIRQNPIVQTDCVDARHLARLNDLWKLNLKRCQNIGDCFAITKT